MSAKKWVVYLVRCSDKSLYCGISNDLKNRLIEHNSGKGARYTRSRRPVELVGTSPEMTKGEALRLEYRIKQLSAGKKMAELKGKESGMTISEKDLQENSLPKHCHLNEFVHCLVLESSLIVRFVSWLSSQFLSGLLCNRLC